MNRWEQSLLINAIKRELKSSKINYSQLAQRLDVSPATVKRILNGNDCTLSRLIAICRELELSFFDLTSRAYEPTPEFYWFNEEQDGFFAEEPRSYWFLHLLSRGRSVAAIKQECHLSAGAAFRYLRKLEKLSLIHIGEGDRLRFRFRGLPQWRENGRMVQGNLKSVISLFFDYLLQNRGEPHAFDSAQRTMLPETLAKMISDVNDLIEKYNRLSAHDRLVQDESRLILAEWNLGVMAVKPKWQERIFDA